MSSYVVIGGSGCTGRHVVRRLLDRDSTARVHLLVPPSGEARADAMARRMDAHDRLKVHAGVLGAVEDVDHVIHFLAAHDPNADDPNADDAFATDVDTATTAVDISRRFDATLHHVSSIAVAGDAAGTFTENDLDVGQGFPTSDHRAAFEAEKLVRAASDLRVRVYRPSVVVGDSITGETDGIHGPYHLFRVVAALAALPSFTPLALPDVGATNLVPVDYVADALVELVHAPRFDGRTLHLVHPRPQPWAHVYSALADAAGAPPARLPVPGALLSPLLRTGARPVAAARAAVSARYEIPRGALEHVTHRARFGSTRTREALRIIGFEGTVPDVSAYAGALWSYWRTDLDPFRARRDDPAGPLVGRHVLVTGGSSGIGKATVSAIARKGARVVVVARDRAKLDSVVAEVRAAGGDVHGYACDLTDDDAVADTVAAILRDHDHIDMLVNNAGRSIRRSLTLSTDRLHDFERTMAVNYFGALRLILALLPQMRERRFGHVVNISSASVQSHVPRFSAYVASKAALDAFTSVAAAETLADGVTFTTIHMPLVDTPMIAPSGKANVNKVETVEKAAAMVVRALIEKPKRIDVPTGTFAEWGALVLPRSADRVMASYYRAYPDSPAAKGVADTSTWSSGPRAPKQNRRNPRLPRVVRRLGRWVPGAFW